MLAVGVALRIVAYVRRSPLWTDEAALALNVAERSLRDLLLVPLDYGQASPRGFLVLEWFVTRAFGSSDLAFRFVPFASGIVSLVLFFVIAHRLLTRAGAASIWRCRWPRCCSLSTSNAWSFPGAGCGRSLRSGQSPYGVRTPSS